MTVAEFAKKLMERDGFLIVSHIRPDGDTLGSGGALCSALRRAGKTAYCFTNPQTSKLYAPFVAPFAAPEGFEPSHTLTVDVASEGLFPAGIPLPVSMAVDHHPTNTRFAPELLLDGGRSACGEIVLELIKALGGGVTKEEADLLYIAVSTDTGCFQYMNTDAHALRAAAELVELGADNAGLNNRIFRSFSPSRLRLEGMMLEGLRYYRGGLVTLATITRAMLAETGADEDDCEDLAGIAGKAEGSMCSITAREIEGGRVKFSVRSKPPVNVADICAEFGGGGHALAAGCTMGRPTEEAIAALLRVVEEKWPRL